MGRDLSIFVDESGDRGGKARYYILALVVHDQSESIVEKVSRYEQSLVISDLPNIPFHSEPLLNGHGPYEGMPIAQRKKLLYSFNVMVQRLPVSYAAFRIPEKPWLGLMHTCVKPAETGGGMCMRSPV